MQQVWSAHGCAKTRGEKWNSAYRVCTTQRVGQQRAERIGFSQRDSNILSSLSKYTITHTPVSGLSYSRVSRDCTRLWTSLTWLRVIVYITILYNNKVCAKSFEYSKKHTSIAYAKYISRIALALNEIVCVCEVRSCSYECRLNEYVCQIVLSTFTCLPKESNM